MPAHEFHLMFMLPIWVSARVRDLLEFDWPESVIELAVEGGGVSYVMDRLRDYMYALVRLSPRLFTFMLAYVEVAILLLPTYLQASGLRVTLRWQTWLLLMQIQNGTFAKNAMNGCGIKPLFLSL
jgi:hypothetical protein